VNGPNIGILVPTLGVGAFMFIAWYLRDNPFGPPGTWRHGLLRAVTVLVWLSAVIAILVLANDQSQPWLTAYLVFAWLLSFQRGMRDLKARKVTGTSASSDTDRRD
jgi:formate-dependent nitrite reductase membrane component NrfD